MSWFFLTLTVLSAWLLADFLTGIVHWAQDRLLLEETRFKILNQIKADNDLHHSKPAALVQLTWWQNINTSVPFAVPASILFYWLDLPLVFCLAVFFGSFANLVHRFSHMPRGKLNGFIKFMQWTGLFISIEHHRAHHFDKKGVIRKEDTTGKYCPMTNWVNPTLDKIQFFRFLEYLFKK